MGIKFNGREIESLKANGLTIIEAVINGRVVWPEESDFHWQPNPDMVWAKNQWEALAQGRIGYLRMHYAKDLVNDFFYEQGTVVTSDGQTYQNSEGVEHIWDYSNSRVSAVYPTTKVVWTMYFPNNPAVYPSTIEYGETYFCFDGVTADWYPCLWTDIAYFDLLNQASVFIDDSSVALYLGFFNECRKLQAIPKEFTMILSAYRLRGIFSGCTALTSVPYLDMTNAIYGMGMFEGRTNLKELKLVNINTSIDLSPCINLTKSSLRNVLAGLTNRTGQDKLAIGLGAANIAKLSQSELSVALNKNWDVVETITNWPDYSEDE
ncbi:hypothetical protein LNN31_07895 [Acetobacterium wieringae]|uniref:Leucine-rich repeat domain-containing protein n=1 Tax=Acetobacterium wieringae TaxID=52694 RepID=A0ABY6HKC7_9FIRM|nr:hypothetical protein [Acetobacterium wieringae]UYO64329.1 hypothetical protein LNN31_07895 [Acetobacterium wieringae]VUZ27081.1 Uncharacterised protein [Acetobacterium wieringae]